VSKPPNPTVVIRRVRKKRAAHHGGSWKIAYADFVTAMMAFFLLMWLLGSTTQGDLQGIADYFNTPLRVALQGGSGSGDSSSVIQGGGQDLTRSYGQVEKTDNPVEKRTINLQAARAEMQRAERQRLEDLKSKIQAAIEQEPQLAEFAQQIKLDITREGLRIQIVDDQNRPMFDTGRAMLRDYTREILRQIGRVLNDVDNRISLAGHTDAAPYALGERAYSNWELSADRANASRRELVAAGIDEGKIVRVVGLAASVPFNESNPLDPSNRRISIVVLNKESEEQLLETATADVKDDEGAAQALVARPDEVAPQPGAAPLPPDALTRQPDAVTSQPEAGAPLSAAPAPAQAANETDPP
jgi:chemotaxis protein MotB